MLIRKNNIVAPGGKLRAPGLLPKLLQTIVILGIITGGIDAMAESESEAIAALRQLIEHQNLKIDSLNEKVRTLEARENSRDSVTTNQRLPAIVIDTNGVPIGSAVPPVIAANVTNTTASATNQAMAQLSIGQSGFSMRSADSNYSLTLHGLVQADSRTFIDDNSLSRGNDGFLLRRARPILEGSIYRDFDFMIVPEFGGSTVQLFDAYVNYKPRPELQFRAGKFKGPVGLENLQSDTAASFNEKSLASDFIPMRNLGFQAHGEIDGGTLNWASGIFAGDGDNRVAGNSGFNDDMEVAGRLFLQPFKTWNSKPLQGLGFGIAASASDVTSNSAGLPSTTGGTLAGYTTTGQQQFFAYNPSYGSVVADGLHSRISPQGYYYYGPFGLQGEYVFNEQSVLNNSTLRHARLDHSAWQLSAQWVLTGENASFNSLTPAHPFNPKEGHWGAWQLVARYSELDLDKATFKGFSDPTTSAQGASAWTAGINWWLNRNVRMLTSYSLTTFRGGGTVSDAVPSSLSAPATVSHQDESVIFTRVQIAF